METCLYQIDQLEEVLTPSLIYYPELIQKNIDQAIAMAGSPERLCPHIKTHKCPQVIAMLQKAGVNQFKCATIAEGEMTAGCGAKRIIVSYPLVGPNIERMIALQQRFPETEYIAIGDDLPTLTQLDAACKKAGLVLSVLVDVDMGGHRTGIAISKLEALVRDVAQLVNLRLMGLHCYDGHVSIEDLALRHQAVVKADAPVWALREMLQAQGIALPLMIMGGSPTFPCHALEQDAILSPGTIFLHDYGYATHFPDLPFVPSAVVLARVVSRSDETTFTIDVGYKAIAADPSGVRGYIANLPQAKPQGQSEEHWIFHMEEGVAPSVGTELYVVPTHICPTSALYPQVLVAEQGRVTQVWDVAARRRKLSI